MMDKVKIFFKILLNNKKKFVLLVFSTLVFLFLLFPYGDLGDLVSNQISQGTNNQVYLEFDNMGLSLFGPGVKFENVAVEALQLPRLAAKELSISPSIAALFTQEPGGTLKAKGFMKGDVEISLGSGPKSESGQERKKLIVSASKLSLSELCDLAQSPITVTGSANLESSTLADLTLKDQPEVEIHLQVDKFELPSNVFNSALGPMVVPEVKFASLSLKAHLSTGKLYIDEAKLGKEGDDLTGEIKGDIGIDFQNTASGPIPIWKGYNLSFSFNANKSFQDRAQFFLSLIEKYKTPLPNGGGKYALKIKAPNFTSPPSFEAMH